MIVDGGLGIELERRGFAFATKLWSGEAILTRPDLLTGIHRDYLAAGAHVIETATYQLSHATLRELGYGEGAIDAIFARAVGLAREAIAAHVAQSGASVPRTADGTSAQSGASQNGAVAENGASGALAQNGALADYIVAGSLGPFGATLGDGSEYSGVQHLGRDALYAFHAERAKSMLRAAPDVFLFETIPSRAEGLVIAEVARDLALGDVWISFSCATGECTHAGDRISQVAADLEAFACVTAIGINCTAPGLVTPLVRSIRTATSKPILVCPNLGQTWQTQTQSLSGGTGESAFERCVPEWLDLGVAHIGGCCGVGPSTIAALARTAASSVTDADRRLPERGARVSSR